MSTSNKEEKKASTYKKVPLPDFMEYEHVCNANIFFRACYNLTFLVWTHHFTRFLNLDELWEMANKIWENLDECPDKVGEDEHKACYEVIKRIDPFLSCWYNYFFLCLLQQDKDNEEPKVDITASPYKLDRTYAWYFVVHFVNENHSDHKEIESTYYQEVYLKLQPIRQYQNFTAKVAQMLDPSAKLGL